MKLSRRARFSLIIATAVFVGAALWMRRVPSDPITPSGDAPVATGWRAVQVLRGLEHPWALTWLPNGDALLTERPGRLRLVRAGKLEAKPITGLPAILGQGHGGLMDVSLHPRFAENRWIYLTYGAGTADANSTQLARGRLSPDATALTELQVLHTVTPLKRKFQHFGSRLLWLPDGTLLLALGDGGNPPIRLGGELMREQAQRLDSQLGKILRLREDGTAPSDNPFAGRPDVDPFIWSFGHRNIQGLAHDPASGLLFYTGDKFPAWRGDLFSGALKRQHVRRVDLDSAGRVLGQESIPIGARVRDVRQGPDGFIYVLTDEKDGRLIRLIPSN
jgi:glucose/arabinose dehydrogenase